MEQDNTKHQSRDRLFELIRRTLEEMNILSQMREGYEQAKKVLRREVAVGSSAADALEEHFDLMDDAYDWSFSQAELNYGAAVEAVRSYFDVSLKNLEVRVIGSCDCSAAERIDFVADVALRATGPVQVSISPTLNPKEASAALRRLAQSLEVHGQPAFIEADRLAREIQWSGWPNDGLELE